jgi:hypothetical protein
LHLLSGPASEWRNGHSLFVIFSILVPP